MSFTLSCNVNAGPGYTNPALCSAVLQPHGAVTDAALPASTVVSNTAQNFYFKHRNNGLYSFLYPDMPDGFRGNVDFFYNSILVSSVNVNPEELENTDTKTSTRLSTTSYTAPTAAPTAAQNAAQVRAELTTELARIDANVSDVQVSAPDLTGLATSDDIDSLKGAGWTNQTLTALMTRVLERATPGDVQVTAPDIYLAGVPVVTEGFTSRKNIPFALADLTEVGVSFRASGASAFGPRTSYTVGEVGGVINNGGGFYEFPPLATETTKGVFKFDSLETPTEEPYYEEVVPPTDLAVLLETYDVAKSSDVNVTVPAPVVTVNPTPVTVNPTPVNVTTETVDVTGLATSDDIDAIEQSVATILARTSPPAKLTFASTISEGGTMTIKRGDDYKGQFAHVFTVAKSRLGITDMSEIDSVTLGLDKQFSFVGSVTSQTDTQVVVHVEMTRVETNALAYNKSSYDMQFVVDGEYMTPITGSVIVMPKFTP